LYLVQVVVVETLPMVAVLGVEVEVEPQRRYI
jgi:hypothetical protein